MVHRLRTARPAVEELEPRRVPAVTFADSRAFTDGADPVAEAVADFNGDGRPDFVTANAGSTTVSVFVNATASGAAVTFAAQQTFTTGNNPQGVAVADFNGDGRPDLAVANFQDNTVWVLLNTTAPGSGVVTFAAPRTFAVPYATSMGVGDFNGDGRPDLLVANANSGTVSVVLNTTSPGSGTVSFITPQAFAVGNAPDAVAVADFNGDGRPDLAVANRFDQTVSVLLNTTVAESGTASFAAQQTFAVGNNPDGIAAADFNGDGRPDLAVANLTNNTVSVLLNSTAAGSGIASFAAQWTFAAGSGPDGIAAADLDGDGRPDLAVANEAGTVSVLVNTTPAGATTASFAAQQTLALGAWPDVVAVADFNSDGRSDLAVTNFTGNVVSVLRNTTIPFASTVPVVVGQFGDQGVWEFSHAANTWVQPTSANASRLAADPLGDVVGAFPGAGVWLYRPVSGWRQINGVDATLLAMDVNGDVVAEFPGYGVGEYLPASGWRSLTGAYATLLAVDSLGDVAGEFPGYGLWLFRPSVGWVQINGFDASLLAMDPLGNVVADFKGFGVGEYRRTGGWQSLNGIDARALAVDRYSDVAADFPGFGVGEYHPTRGWGLLTGADASLLASHALDDLLGEFPGHGVWEFDPSRGWFQLTAADAAVLATG
jgi:hypothetical protein